MHCVSYEHTAYGMCDTALNDVYQAVVIAKLTYAVSAGGGLPTLPIASALKVSFEKEFEVVSVAVTFRPLNI